MCSYKTKISNSCNSLLRTHTLILFFILTYSIVKAQTKNITLEDIWQKNTFQMKSFEGFQWMKSGKSYSKLIETKSGFEIAEFDVVTGKKLKVIARNITYPDSNKLIAIEEYSFSVDETMLLIATDNVPIYRYSQKAHWYLYHLKNKRLVPLSGGEYVENATLSPDGNWVAYTKNNNLFVANVSDGKELPITTNGEKNKIINGHSDWVYEEELELIKAFEWSPDSKKIAFYSFDESQVKEYNMQLWGDLYPQDYKFKYPKAGEKNADVSLHIFSMVDNTIKTVFDGKYKDVYVPRIFWANAGTLAFTVLNRNQDTLSIYHVTGGVAKPRLITFFASKDYVEGDATLLYNENDKSFLCTAETDGYRHIYLYDSTGKLLTQVTKGNWEVTEIVGIDYQVKKIYYTSKEASVAENHLYIIDFEGKRKQRLTTVAGVHQITMNSTASYYIDYVTNTETHAVYLHKSDGELVKTLEDNAPFNKLWSEYAHGKTTFGKQYINTDTLNYWLLKPAEFDSTKKYPVLVFVYGGPGSQQVLNSWNGRNRLWFELLLQKGYLVACVDNRGTGGRGAQFRNITTRQLGKLETEDQIGFAKFLSTKQYVDKNRVGIFGWSYGGYMSSLCLLLGADIFKMAIAVAPVTSWRFYDSIYTERFMKTPQDNAKGYDDTAPIKLAHLLKGKYLLIHGTGDDNVHFQNAVEMQDALIKAGKQFDSFFYPNKNHGISGGNTRYHLYQLMTEYIEKNL